jgi:pimeloyl-ACP methyl ester carboxylesterase
VLLHGFGVGSAFFCMNFENLAIGREVIAIDLPGFGRSSRPSFPKEPEKIESMYVTMLEQWRQTMALDNFILLGHSFGGFVAASYTAAYPHRVEHLILADPWGLDGYPDGINWQKPIPSWLKTHHDWEWTHASGFLRACGPLGPLAVRGFSHYICKRFYRFLGGDAWAAADYVYQCNAVDSCATEEAIVNLSKKILWARRPVLGKLSTLPLTSFVSFIYGEESWLDSTSAENFIESRIRGTAELHTIPDVGHDSYAEDPPNFNQIVNAICCWADTRNHMSMASNMLSVPVVPGLKTKLAKTANVETSRAPVLPAAQQSTAGAEESTALTASTVSSISRGSKSTSKKKRGRRSSSSRVSAR